MKNAKTLGWRIAGIASAFVAGVCSLHMYYQNEKMRFNLDSNVRMIAERDSVILAQQVTIAEVTSRIDWWMGAVERNQRYVTMHDMLYSMLEADHRSLEESYRSMLREYSELAEIHSGCHLSFDQYERQNADLWQRVIRAEQELERR